MMFSIFAPRDCRQPIAFCEHFRTSLYPWTMVATGGTGRAPVVTFTPQMHGAAADWITKMQRQKRNIMLLTAETNGAVSGVKLCRGHLRGTRHFSVKLPLAMGSALDAFTPAPFLRLECGHRIYAGWRLLNECPIEAVEAVAKRVAAHLGGISAGHLLPLAGTIHEGARVVLVHLHKNRVNVLTDFRPVEAADAAQDDTRHTFTVAAMLAAKPLAWLWKGAVLRGALSLLAGPGGVGKSTVAASIAATVTTGGTFPGGERAAPGGVIFCEGEDDPESVTLPRLQAAGADLARLVIGPVCDLSQDVAALDAAAKALGETPALLVLSPVRSFFGPESFVETTVRRRIAPVLAWAAQHNVAVLGVSHPPKGKREIGGGVVWTNAARAGFFVEKDAKNPTVRTMTPLKANSGRDDWRLAYTIESAQMSDGIEAGRVVWQGQDATPDSDALPGNVVPLRQPSPATDVDGWLRAALADGPRDAAELKVEATQAGHSERTLYRAVKRMGVVIEGGGFGRPRVWRL
jgi:putative DNA primase/helicase